MLKLLLFDCFLQLDWTRVVNLLDVSNIVVTKAINVDSIVFVEVGSSHIAVETHSVGVWRVLRFHDVEPVGKQV